MQDKVPVNLIVRYLCHEASDEEQEQLLDWVSRDAEHQKIFREYSDILERKGDATFPLDLTGALERLNHTIDEEEKKIVRVPFWTVSRVAAAIALLVIAGTVALLSITLSDPGKQVPEYAERKTVDAERAEVILSDGTKVRLNSGSTLRYPERFNDDVREVYLTGEAFFSVTKDNARPFIVHTGELTTQVLGTSFNIKAGPGQVDVSVATGKVKVSDGIKSEILLPMDKIRYNDTTHNMTRYVADLDDELAWVDNTIAFEDTRLSEAVPVLERWYGVTIALENDALAKCLITGRFKDEPLAHILEAIGFSTGIQYTINNGEVKLSGKGCE